MNLGASYTRATGDDRAENLGSAARAFEAALRIYRDNSMAFEVQKICSGLTEVYGELGQWEQAARVAQC